MLCGLVETFCPQSEHRVESEQNLLSYQLLAVTWNSTPTSTDDNVTGIIIMSCIASPSCGGVAGLANLGGRHRRSRPRRTATAEVVAFRVEVKLKAPVEPIQQVSSRQMQRGPILV